MKSFCRHFHLKLKGQFHIALFFVDLKHECVKKKIQRFKFYLKTGSAMSKGFEHILFFT